MNMKPRLIVLSGDAGAGKDSVAKMLIEKHGWHMHSLSGPLKRFAGDMFGFSDDQLYGPSKFRNEPDPRWERPCPSCGGGDAALVAHSCSCDICCGSGTVNDNSPRRVLQVMAEECLRQMVHVDVFTMRARPEIEALLNMGYKVVVNDARYDNDRRNLREWLGASRVDVRTNRIKPITPESVWRLHASEQSKAQDDEIEHIIHQDDERWPFPSLPMKVEEMLRLLELDS